MSRKPRKPRKPPEVALFDRNWASSIIALAALQHTGNKKSASKLLGISIGAFDSRLKSLHADLNLDLWHAKAGGMLEDGHAVLELARSSFEHFNREIEVLRERYEPERGILRVGFSASTRLIVLDAVSKLRDRLQGLTLHLSEDRAARVEQCVRDGELDIGVTTRLRPRKEGPAEGASRDTRAGPKETLLAEVLLPDTPLKLVGRAEDLGDGIVAVDDLNPYIQTRGLILLSRGLRSRDVVDEYLETVGLANVPVRTETTSVGVMLELVLRGHGLALLHLPSEEILDRNGLACRDLGRTGSTACQLEMVLFKRDAVRAASATDYFATYLREVLGSHSKG